MSGTALSPGAVRDTAINATWFLDRKLHCRSFNSSQLLECFKKQLKDEILDISASVCLFGVNKFEIKLLSFLSVLSSLREFSIDFVLAIDAGLQRAQCDDYEDFVPVVDGIGGVLPESPEMLATYRRKMPMIIGTTRDESSLKICWLFCNFQ